MVHTRLSAFNQSLPVRNAPGTTPRSAIHPSLREYFVSAVLSRRGQRGLGLVGIQERLNAMGGTLRIQSATGQGTQLLITIPMEK